MLADITARQSLGLSCVTMCADILESAIESSKLTRCINVVDINVDAMPRKDYEPILREIIGLAQECKKSWQVVRKEVDDIIFNLDYIIQVASWEIKHGKTKSS